MIRPLVFLSLLLLLSLPLAGGGAYGQNPPGKEGAWRRDPFRYTTVKEVAAKTDITVEDPELAVEPVDLQLQGIVLARDGSFHALINGREVKQGDLLGELRVQNISRFAIVVEESGKSKEIDLFHHPIKWGEQ